MADRVESFTVTCAASSAAGRNLNFSPGEIESIEVSIPQGHANLTTIIITYANNQVVPFTPGATLSGDDTTYVFDIGSAPTGGAWGCQLNNADVLSHSWTINFYINEIVVEPGQGAQLPLLVVPLVTAA